MQYRSIECVLFDLGAVVLDIDNSAFVAALPAISHIDVAANLADFNVFYQDFENGLMTEQDFFLRIQAMDKSDSPVAVPLLKEAWNAILKKPSVRACQLIELIAGKFTLLLASNSNVTHFNQFEQTFKDIWGNEGLNRYFKKTYFSFEMHCSKPDPLFYQSILKDAGFMAEQCFFIDDKEENTGAAIQLGIRSFTLRKKEGWDQIENLLKENS